MFAGRRGRRTPGTSCTDPGPRGSEWCCCGTACDGKRHNNGAGVLSGLGRCRVCDSACWKARGSSFSAPARNSVVLTACIDGERYRRKSKGREDASYSQSTTINVGRIPWLARRLGRPSWASSKKAEPVGGGTTPLATSV